MASINYWAFGKKNEHNPHHTSMKVLTLGRRLDKVLWRRHQSVRGNNSRTHTVY